MKTLLIIVGALGLVYLLVVAFYALVQRSLIYYPTTLALEEARQLAASQGGAPWLDEQGRWMGWKIGPDGDGTGSGRPRALVFHGNAGMALHRGYYAGLLAGFERSGPWTVYIGEYPGYGPRAGAPGEAALVAAAVDAVDHLLAQDPEPLLIVGESIGGGVASAVVRQRPDGVTALLLISPFDTLANVARHHMPWLPAGLLLRDRYDNRAALEGFREPLVVMSAGQDEIVPAALAEPLLRQHAGPTLHRVQETAGHNTLHFDPQRAPWPAVDAFLAQGRGP